MKIVSWNINGLRAVLKNTGKDLRGFLDSLEADVICLQETKTTKDQLDSSLYEADGYNGYFSFCRVKSGYSGVATFCKDRVTPVVAEEGLTGVLWPVDATISGGGSWSDFTDEELSTLDAEGRAVITEHQRVCEAAITDQQGVEGGGQGRVVVVNCYCPMVDSDNPERLDYKLRFYAALRERCRALHEAGKLVVAVGDYNCSLQAIDSAYIRDDPSLLKNSPARKWMKQFVVSSPSSSSASSTTQLVDSFRCLHPSQEKAYTCWSTVLDCRKTNYGTRIDYILLSPALVPCLRFAEVWAHLEGSDHCPVYAELDLKLTAASRPPPLCSCYFSELKQQKLSVFLSAKPRPRGPASDGGETSQTGNVSRKRSMPATASSSSKTRKTSQAVGKGQASLLAMFQKSSKPLEAAEQTAEDWQRDSDSGYSSQGGTVVEATPPLLSSQPSTTEPLPPPVLPSLPPLSSQLSEEWRSVFSGPPKPPLCQGHQEPCVLRTVKKAGPNRNRQFWSCARPGGSKDDPGAKCNYFKWASVMRTGKVKVAPNSKS